MAELDDQKIARLGGGEHHVPITLRDERAAAAPAERMILDANFIRVKIFADDVAPATFAATGIVHRRVAHDEQHWKRAVRVREKTGFARHIAIGVEVGGVVGRSRFGSAHGQRSDGEQW